MHYIVMCVCIIRKVIVGVGISPQKKKKNSRGRVVKEKRYQFVLIFKISMTQ